jgi:phosphoserine phosphatase RsbU/P
MAEITIQTGRSRERVPLLKERITIGRSRDSDIFLPDQWLSRQHAEIRRRDGGFFLADLASKNGTLLNGSPARKASRLQDGDVITLGEHVLTFNDEEAREEEAPAGTRVFSARVLSELQLPESVDTAELARQHRILGVLTAAARALLVHKPLPDVFEQVLDLLFQAVPAERGAILLLEGAPAEPVIKASRSRGKQPPPTRVSRSIARRVMEQLDSLLLPNLLEDTALRNQDSILSTGIRSALCAPLWFRSEAAGKDAVIGLVYLDSLLSAKPFTEEDLQIVTALANVAAAKIENSRLLEESMEKRRLEEDMRVAAEIQRALLPANPPRVPGYEIAGCNYPCHGVGGDYYDYVLEDGALLLALADVSGKGTGAALIMTVLRAAVRAHWGEIEICEAVARINRTVCQNISQGKYATFFTARLDPGSGTLQFVNAGHNPPLLVRADGTVETLSTGGMVLGLFESIPYDDEAVEMRVGDTLVIYSDGVTETWSPEDVEYGDGRLTELLVSCRHLGAEEVQQRILEEVGSFAAGAKATDDRTLIVVKRAS